MQGGVGGDEQHHLALLSLGENLLGPFIAAAQLGAVDENVLFAPPLLIDQPLPQGEGVILFLTLIADEKPRHFSTPKCMTSRINLTSLGKSGKPVAPQPLQPLARRSIPLKLDLSRICAAPSARLGHFPLEGERAFPAQC